MQLRHISPRSSDWVDAMEGGGSQGWEKLAPEERTKLRLGEFAAVWERAGGLTEGARNEPDGQDGKLEKAEEEDDYGWGEPSASR
jgi:hypothetical protein